MSQHTMETTLIFRRKTFLTEAKKFSLKKLKTFLYPVSNRVITRRLQAAKFFSRRSRKRSQPKTCKNKGSAKDETKKVVNINEEDENWFMNDRSCCWQLAPLNVFARVACGASIDSKSSNAWCEFVFWKNLIFYRDPHDNVQTQKCHQQLATFYFNLKLIKKRREKLFQLHHRGS